MGLIDSNLQYITCCNMLYFRNNWFAAPLMLRISIFLYLFSVACSNVYGNDSLCDKWAIEGECYINPKWMPENCRKSCRMCADQDIVPTTTPQPDPDAGTLFNPYPNIPF